MSSPKRRTPRPDPRAEPDDLPSDRHDAPASIVADDKLADREGKTPAPPPSAPIATADAPVSSAPVTTPERSSASIDSRLTALEPMLAANDWAAVAAHLGPPDRAADLPPALALIYAVARKELQPANSETRGDNDAAIHAMARLLGGAPNSAAALLFTKRLLRKNPVSLGARSAPRASVSVAIIVIGILLGGIVGYAVQFGPWAHDASGTRGVRTTSPAR